MIEVAVRALDPTRAALARAADRGITVRPWIDAHAGQRPAPRMPTLYVVDDDATPPSMWTELEDWVRASADSQGFNSFS